MALQHYNPNDLLVRTAVAACALGCLGAKMAKKWRGGSITTCESKNFQIAIAQMNCIRMFSVLELPAKSKLIVKADGGTDVASTISINSIVISDPILFTTDVSTTAGLIADAINNFTSTPDYTATSNGAEVVITAVTKGASTNGYNVIIVGGDFTASTPYMTGGQDGVSAEDNAVTEAQLESMFNNISSLTGCCYAPLGYGYESISTNVCRVALTLNTGADVELNNSPDICELNKLC